MKFTDIFIKRPVLSTVVSLLILVLGCAAIFKLSIRQYPEMTNTTITITTAYPGASAELVKGFITNPIQQSVGSANGIDYMVAKSDMGVSTITVYIKLNYNPDSALTEITGKVSAVLNKLPQGAQSPTITKATGETMPSLILGFTSDKMSPEEVTAYLKNAVQPNLNALGGISSIVIWGEKSYAMRVWLNNERMAMFKVTPQDVLTALQGNNVQASIGRMKGKYDFINVTADTDLHDVEQFENLVLKNEDGNLIHLRDVSTIKLAPQDTNVEVKYNGIPAIFAGVNTAPGANPLTVAKEVLKALPGLERNFPPGLSVHVVYNGTTFISAAIYEVIKTIIEATVIVLLVIFLALGSFRAVLIPIVTIPLSLIGVCFFMLLMGFSINLLTLLAMVLAIGLVVDDAIVVLENIYQHIEAGKKPFEAAIEGAREIAGPIIVMTLTLAAVYAPIGFTEGITGVLFTEFAFTLAFSVIISGVIALTFSPMMTSKLISAEVLHAPFVQKVDRAFNWLKDLYQNSLKAALSIRPMIIMLAVVVIGACYFFFTHTKSELAPQEDQSFLGLQATGPTQANVNYLTKYTPELEKIYNSLPEQKDSFTISGYPNSNAIFSGVILKPWGERTLSQMALAPVLTEKVKDVAGVKPFVFQFPSLPGSSGNFPVEFVLTTTGSYLALNEVMDGLKEKALKSGMFVFVDSDLKFNRPEVHIKVNREKAADLGLSMADIANALSVTVSSARANYFSKLGYSYEVIPQLPQERRSNRKDLSQVYVKSNKGAMVPLSSVVSYTSSSEPSTLMQFQQLNAATFNAMLMPGVTIGQALDYLRGVAHQDFPKEISYDYGGQSRQFMNEGNSLMYAFLLALIVIFLLLAAQFESFRDPFIIMISVPLSICGALIPLFLGAATINIYTQVGLITLIGLITKHGILIVQFANNLQIHEGKGRIEAVLEASGMRLRPILMTTAAMVFGVLPLVIAKGAGAVSRNNIGIVIFFGMLIGTCFTLYVVPVIYSYIARVHNEAKGSA